ncbi:MAG: competence/damage-inducible protein A [Gemmatimonadota bacterium]|nr:MAG: competence/damage-inducible protein A [Gemmatimonadota bacterium]
MEASVPTAAIVAIGDELLLGDTVDTNSAWLGRRFSDLGIPASYGCTIPDTRADIMAAVARASASAEVVVVSGGLGPTPDDRTREAMAELTGAALRVDGELLAGLEERFRARGYESLPERNVSQAQILEGARILPNTLGTAPGQAVEVEGSLVILLPGVPSELVRLVEEQVVPLLSQRFAGRLRPLHHRRIHTTGIPESVLAERVESALPEEMGPVGLAYLPGLGGVEIRLTARGVGSEEAARWLDAIEEALDPAVKEYRYHSDRHDLADALGSALVSLSQTVAVAESCTGGLISKRLTDLPGASRYFVGGLVAYDDRIKTDRLGVSRADIEAHGVVSEDVAAAMARGIAQAMGADAGLGVTGIAGPDGGSDQKPVGTVCFAAYFNRRCEVRRECFNGDRAGVRERAAQATMALLLRMVEAG